MAHLIRCTTWSRLRAWSLVVLDSATSTSSIRAQQYITGGKRFQSRGAGFGAGVELDGFWELRMGGARKDVPRAR